MQRTSSSAQGRQILLDLQLAAARGSPCMRSSTAPPKTIHHAGCAGADRIPRLVVACPGSGAATSAGCGGGAILDLHLADNGDRTPRSRDNFSTIEPFDGQLLAEQ